MTSENIISTAAQEPVAKKVPRRKKRKGYFYEEEEDAFKRYITSTDEFERNRIFNTKLLPAFTKMIESIIRRYNLFVPCEEFEDTFNDTLSFLMTKVNNFDVTKKYKAFSYCGTICKNYLILKRTQYMRNKERLNKYEETHKVTEDDIVDGEDAVMHWDVSTEVIKHMIKELDFILSERMVRTISENEKKVGYALYEILRNYDTLFRQFGSNKFNKTSILYFIKEYTMLNTDEVRNAMKLFKSVYFVNKDYMLRKLH